MVLASCTAKSTSITTQTSTTETTPIISTTSTTTSAQTTTTTTSTAVSVTTTSTGNWWDTLGTPQYGGTLTIAEPGNFTNWDPYNSSPLPTCMSAYLQTMYTDIWTMNPSAYNYVVRPSVVDDMQGELCQSWEWSDPQTMVFHLRHNIYWDNLPPANGRQFVAADVAYHLNRLYGLGGGFTTPSPYQSKKNLLSVTVIDSFNVALNWSAAASPEYEVENMTSFATGQCYECPDVVQAAGNANNWHTAIGTGPYIVTDWVDSAQATLVANPNFWGVDERYPQNKLPYIKQLDILIIANSNLSLAALRTGKIGALEALTYETAKGLKQTNPELTQVVLPGTSNDSLAMDTAVAPFNNISVRIALQKTIDLTTLAATYYNGTSPYPASQNGNQVVGGWAYTYPDWTQTLKDTYSYDAAAAKTLLAGAGYPNGFTTNIIAQTGGISPDLLNIVQSYFAAVNVTMNIQMMDSATWTNYVWTQHKATQMSSRGGGELGQISEPLSDFAFLAANTGGNAEMINDPTYENLYKQAVSAPTTALAKQYVYQTNVYVAAQHWALCLLVPNLNAAYEPWFHGYAGQFDAIACGNVGPHKLGFFCSRFWLTPH